MGMALPNHEDQEPRQSLPVALAPKQEDGGRRGVWSEVL